VVPLSEPLSRSRIVPAESRQPPIPRGVKAGIGTIVFGLVLDLSEHSFAMPASTGTGFSPGQHAAHLVILVGMVVVLAGVITDGIHAASRQGRQKRDLRDAIR
jgi:hypothetical protein